MKNRLISALLLALMFSTASIIIGVFAGMAMEKVLPEGYSYLEIAVGLFSYVLFNVLHYIGRAIESLKKQ